MEVGGPGGMDSGLVAVVVHDGELRGAGGEIQIGEAPGVALPRGENRAAALTAVGGPALLRGIIEVG
jgi:hypothetical protein